MGIGGGYVSFWAEGLEPKVGSWAPLFYPAGHDWVGMPLDLAFAIYGVEDVCEPDATGSACKQAGCPAAGEDCSAKCMNFDPVTGVSTVIACECDASTDCHAEAAPPPPNRCVQPDNGTGTVTLPPQGCEYLSPDEVHLIIDGLPPGTTIELDAIHMDFICGQPPPMCSLPLSPGQCEMPGGSLGGHGDCFESILDLTVSGTGMLAGFNRHLFVPVFTEVHTGPRNPGDPVQTFPNDMYRLMGELFGDPDFCTFRVTGGTDFGLPSPGQTTLTDIGGGLYEIDSFFDVAYVIEFEGCPGSMLDGFAGATMATIRMATGGAPAPPTCVGDCPLGMVCEETVTPQPDGTNDVCCNCVQAPCEPTPDGSQCQPAQECTDISETCDPHCMQFDSATGQTTITDCECFDVGDCHVVPPPAAGQDNPCIVNDNGTGTVTLPPAGCEYLSPNEVHEIINGLPPATTIELDASHRNFLNVTTSPGGSLGGEIEQFDSGLFLTVRGTGSLAGFNRFLAVPVSSEVHTGPRRPGDPVQTFPTDMYRLEGELFGDPDFCALRVTAGAYFGLPPSPGQATITDIGGGLYHIDSFFDITYQIEFEGCPGSQLDGYMGTTMATIRMRTGTDLPTCAGGCDAGSVCQQTVTGDGNGVIDVCCDCVPDVCEPTPDGSGCTSLGCPAVSEDCKPRCMDYDPQTQATSVSVCDCGGLGDCHPVPTPPITDPCVVADNGTGTITLPPAGCEYVSPNEVHAIIDGLAPGTTIALDPIHLDFTCLNMIHPYCSLGLSGGQCETVGGTLGGHGDCFESTLDLTVSGTGDLTGFNRHLAVPLFTEIHTASRNPGDPVQSFAADMFRLHGELFGDPDFCTFRVMGGTDFGLPSPGHTILTDLGNGTYNVDSFFDVAYTIEFEGCPGSQLDGYQGTTMATIRMKTGGALAPPSCVGDCPPGTVCVQDITQNPDGTVEVCCNCEEPPNPPGLPPDGEHQALKHRYVSIDATTNYPDVVAWKVELVEYKRCAGDRERACTEDSDCDGGATGPCDNLHPAVGLSWWVQAPQELTAGCRQRCDTHDGAFCNSGAECPGNDCSKRCGATDQFARLEPTGATLPYFSDWTDPRFPLTTLHIGDCEVVPIASYEIRACAPPDGAVCGQPLRIGTIEQPWLPGVRANFGDIVRAPATPGAPYTGPDGIVNVTDMQALSWILTNWPGTNTPQIHVTWADLQGNGTGSPPQYVPNAADLQMLKKALGLNSTWTGAHTDNRNPNNCPP